jgi:choloylglycine hydrolase
MTVLKESTQWVTFRDLTKRIMYFRTYGNQNLRKIDLQKLDFSGTAVKRIPLFAAAEIIVDVTDQAR